MASKEKPDSSQPDRKRPAEDDLNMASKKKPASEDDKQIPSAASSSSLSAEESRRISAIYKPVLRKKLDQLVQAKDAKAMEMLSAFFPASNFPVVKKSAHCVYCCKSFDPRYANITVCSIQHDIEDWDREYVSAAGSRWSGSCRICGDSFEGTSKYDDEPPQGAEQGYCYYGPHDSSDDALRRVMEWKDEAGEEFDCAVCEERAEKMQGTGKK